MQSLQGSFEETFQERISSPAVDFAREQPVKAFTTIQTHLSITQKNPPLQSLRIFKEQIDLLFQP